MSTDPLVEFSNVGFSTSETTILRDVNLTLYRGDVLGVAGPNGSGKTTLLRLLSTLLRPTHGIWSILGVSEASARHHLVSTRPAIALLGHTPALWPELTLRENVEIVAQLESGNGLNDALEVVGLSGAADRRADRASLGMLRRVEFARVFNQLPTLLLLDEAHAGLDADASAIVAEVVRRVVASNGVTVMVSHETTRVEGLTTRSAVIRAGTIVEVTP